MIVQVCRANNGLKENVSKNRRLSGDDPIDTICADQVSIEVGAEGGT